MGRKATLAWAIFLVSSALTAAAILPPAAYVTLVTLVYSGFVAGNVGSKFTGGK